jgi:hypothetical protein
MSPDDFYVWLHTCERRRGQIDATLGSLAHSDLREYVVEEHPTRRVAMEFWWEAMLRAYDSEKPFIVRLEDDIVVAPKILEALCAWRPLTLPKLGVGLLAISPFGEGMIVEEIGWNAWESKMQLSCPAMAQVFPRRNLERIMMRVKSLRANYWRHSEPPLIDFDVAVSRACEELGLSIYVHKPFLVAPTKLHDASTHVLKPGHVTPRIPPELVDLAFNPAAQQLPSESP